MPQAGVCMRETSGPPEQLQSGVPLVLAQGSAVFQELRPPVSTEPWVLCRVPEGSGQSPPSTSGLWRLGQCS